MCGASVVSYERSSQVHLSLLWLCFAALNPRNGLLRVEKDMTFHRPYGRGTHFAHIAPALADPESAIARAGPLTEGIHI